VLSVPLDKCLPGRQRSSVLNSAPASSAAALNARLRGGMANADSERATGRPQIVQLFYSATGNRRGSGTGAYRRLSRPDRDQGLSRCVLVTSSLAASELIRLAVGSAPGGLQDLQLQDLQL